MSLRLDPEAEEHLKNCHGVISFGLVPWVSDVHFRVLHPRE